MAKRLSHPISTPSSPPRKHARYLLTTHLHIDQKDLELIASTLRLWGITSRSTNEDIRIYLPMIHGFVSGLVKKLQSAEDCVSEAQFRENCNEQGHHFFGVLRKAVDEGANQTDQQAVVDHDVFWNRAAASRSAFTELLEEVTALSSQNKAIEDSWKAEFIDQSPLNGLRMHIERQLALGLSGTTSMYARYCSITQSSGMGKSRLLDEFSKNYFLIPINLRSATSQGYPPADHTVREYLTRVRDKNYNTNRIVMSQMRRFLLVLFNETKKVLQNYNMGHTKADRIKNFRSFMSGGQSMQGVGKDRHEFYARVVAQADQESSDCPSIELIKKALEELRTDLNADGDQMTGRIRTNTTDKFVDVFVAFDEAHTLTDSFDEDKKESRFVVLRRELYLLSSYPLFSFFVSTTGKITQSGPPRGHDSSNRINYGTLATPRPYIYLGFDQLMQSRKIFSQWTTLEGVTSLECVAHMGRPLWGSRYDHGDDEVRRTLLDFAIQKLLCGVLKPRDLNDAHEYAILSQRLPLDVNTPQHLLHLVNPLALTHKMHEQVANHMRIIMAAGDGMESLRAVASSEPILSEAASRIMILDGFCLPKVLSDVLTGYSIGQGDRGELLVFALFTWARDQAARNEHPLLSSKQLCPRFSVKDLFSYLFSKSVFTSMLGDMPSLCHAKATQRPFGEVFSHAVMHFNHIVKPQEQKLLARRYLLLFMARGAAALGSNCQPGFDAVYPYLYGGTDLDVKKVGFIIVQVKNDPKISETDTDLFREMDPFKCGLLRNLDKEDGRFPIPIIRIVFLLTKDTHEVTRMTYNLPSEGAVSIEDGQPLFDSYDYVCSGVSRELLRPVEDSPDDWVALLNQQDQWRNFYKVDESHILRSQLPLCASDDAHYRSWVDDGHY